MSFEPGLISALRLIVAPNVFDVDELLMRLDAVSDIFWRQKSLLAGKRGFLEIFFSEIGKKYRLIIFV